MKKMVLSLLVDNTSGVLSRVSGMFSRRGYNIDSLSVGVTENPRYSRMTVAVSGDDRILSQIKKQLLKLEDVCEITELKDGESVAEADQVMEMSCEYTVCKLAQLLRLPEHPLRLDEEGYELRDASFVIVSALWSR